MSKKVIIAGVCGVTAVAILAAYFLIVPNIQVAAYEQTVATKQVELSDNLHKLENVRKSDVFIKVEGVELSKIHEDVISGMKLAEDAEAKLDAVKNDLTNFNSLPLLDTNEKYRTALLLKSDMEDYVTQTDAYIEEMKSVLMYFFHSAEIAEKIAEIGDGVATDSSEAATKVDKTTVRLQSAIDMFADLTPPASLKEAHDYEVTALNDITGQLRQLAAAIRAGDTKKQEAIGKEFTASYKGMVEKSNAYNAKFIRESNLSKLDATLDQLEKSIIRKQASL